MNWTHFSMPIIQSWTGPKNLLMPTILQMPRTNFTVFINNGGLSIVTSSDKCSWFVNVRNIPIVSYFGIVFVLKSIKNKDISQLKKRGQFHWVTKPDKTYSAWMLYLTTTMSRNVCKSLRNSALSCRLPSLTKGCILNCLYDSSNCVYALKGEVKLIVVNFSFWKSSNLSLKIFLHRSCYWFQAFNAIFVNVIPR